MCVYKHYLWRDCMALLAKMVAEKDMCLVKTMVLESEDPPNLIYKGEKKIKINK